MKQNFTQIRLAVSFYLGLGAPALHKNFPGCRVRAVRGCDPELVYNLLKIYLGRADKAVGSMERVNFRCAKIMLTESNECYFFKEFPTHHLLHNLERHFRCSRVDRAWRAAHLLPQLGIHTPPAIGTVIMSGDSDHTVEYLVTAWLERAIPFPDLVKETSVERACRTQAKGVDACPPEIHREMLFLEFARQLRNWHERGIYLRDLVKNVLVTQEIGERRYWLTDLDGLHPFRRLNRHRILHHFHQLAHWIGPLNQEQAALIGKAYLGKRNSKFTEKIIRALLS